jgi:tetratricopeptide (TPR) repeat protein
VGSDEVAVEKLAEQVWAVSEGNPFLVVETMRALQEGTTSEGLRNLPMPQRVRNVILRRLERLSPQSEPLVAVAAVIGRDFDFALLERAGGLGRRKAAESLEELVRRGVLHGVGERFDFAHGRIREVAYCRLLPPRRKLLHGEVAKALEVLYAKNLEPHYAALAVHYREGEVWDKALTYLRYAGVQADARSAHREAVACFEQALVAITHLRQSRETVEQTIDLRFDLRNSLAPLAEFDRILDHLREAETLATALGDPRRLGRLSVYLTSYFWFMGDYDRTIESACRALNLAAEIGDSALQVWPNAFLGSVHHVRGDYRCAIDALSTNVACLKDEYLYRRLGLAVLPCVWARTWLAWSLADVGAFSEAIASAEEGVRLAEAVDQSYTIILAYFGLGLAYLGSGDLQRATPALERSLLLCQAREVPVIFPWIASALGYAYALLGRIGEALPLLEQAVEQAALRKILAHQSLRVAWLSECYLLAGRMEDAIRFGLRALDLARDRQELGHEAWALRLLGEIASKAEPLEIEKAEDYYHQAMPLADELGMRPLVAHCHLGLGVLSHKAGRLDQARSELSAAIELFRSMDMAFWLTRAEARLTTAGG